VNGIIEITGAFTNSFAINVTAADNGLSKSNPTTVVLGQDFGAVGDPAAIFSPRELPIDPGAFIEMRAGTAFTTGGQSILGIINDGSVSGQVFVVTLEQIGAAAAANLNLINSSVGGSGPRIQITGEVASGLVVVRGTDAAIYPAALQNTIGVSSNSNHNIANVTQGRAGNGTHSMWGDDGAGTPQEYYRFLPPVSGALDFGNTAAQTSADLTIAVPGAQIGYSVSVAVVSAAPPANCLFTGFVSAAGVVTVRFHNYSAAAIDPANLTFAIGVVGILP